MPDDASMTPELPATDDEYFEELTKAVFQGNQSMLVVEEKWPGFRRAFSNFSVRDVADYLPEDVDRLMQDPEIIRNLTKIEGTIENAAEMLLIEIDYGSFADYLQAFESEDALIDDLTRRFRQLGPDAARAFVQRVNGTKTSTA